MPAAFWPDQHDDHRAGRDRTRQREHVEELARGDPVMHLHRLALHVGQHRRAAAERQQRQQAEHRGDLQQRGDHRARSTTVTARLAGSITSSTSSSGMRRMPMPTMMAPATSAGPTRRMLCQRQPEPVARLKPMAAAPAPASAALSRWPPDPPWVGEVEACPPPAGSPAAPAAARRPRPARPGCREAACR